MAICPDWSNKFGIATVPKIIKVRSEYNSLFADWCDCELNLWAVNDGFENFKEADKWFSRVHGVEWMHKPWDIIHIKGDWLKTV